MSPEPAAVGHFGSEVVRHLLAAFPWPLLGLAGYGLLAPSDGDPRVGAAGGVLGTLLLVGFAAGGLAGDRLDLLPMLVPPLVVLAGVGLERLLARSPTRRRGLVAVLAGASLASSLAGPDRAVLDAGRGVVTADGPEAELVRQVARDHLEWRGE
jgi:hypothetical protein